MLSTRKLLGVSITNEREEKILEHVTNQIVKGDEKVFITTPNPEILVYASHHLGYKNKLNSANVALVDGIGLLLGSWLMGRSLKSRITGVDFMEKLCMASREKPMSMGFLGGRSGVAERTVERLLRKYPWLNIVFVAEEWSESGFTNKFVSSSKYQVVSSKNEKTKEDIHATKYMIHNTKEIDILFVAFGFPKQEEWIYENLPKIPVKAAMGVGGAFDYLSGEVPRAPKLVRSLGLEWLFRLIVQPWRWRRQLSLLTFLCLVLKERFTK